MTAVLAAVAATVGAADAFASCNENGSLFWADSQAGFGATGTKQDLVVRAHSNVGAGCQTNGLVAGGTSHMSPKNGGGALVETGWRDKTDGSGNHYFRLFTESCFASGCNVREYSSGCASAGTTVTMIVKSASPGSNVWSYSYACNGGGFSSLGNSGGESFSYASPRVETFRFGPSGSTLFILDYHNALGHYSSYGNLFRDMGTLVCVYPMPGTYGVPNANPATAWHTAPSGGC